MTRVIVVEDNEVMLCGILRVLLSSEKIFEVCGILPNSAGDKGVITKIFESTEPSSEIVVLRTVDEIVEQILSREAGILLLDHKYDGLTFTGEDIARKLAQVSPDLKIIGISTLDQKYLNAGFFDSKSDLDEIAIKNDVPCSTRTSAAISKLQDLLSQHL
jgi:CheY-like chemotaxis protein